MTSPAVMPSKFIVAYNLERFPPFHFFNMEVVMANFFLCVIGCIARKCTQCGMYHQLCAGKCFFPISSCQCALLLYDKLCLNERFVGSIENRVGATHETNIRSCRGFSRCGFIDGASERITKHARSRMRLALNYKAEELTSLSGLHSRVITQYPKH
jgi:hypothetical protein